MPATIKGMPTTMTWLSSRRKGGIKAELEVCVCMCVRLDALSILCAFVCTLFFAPQRPDNRIHEHLASTTFFADDDDVYYPRPGARRPKEDE